MNVGQLQNILFEYPPSLRLVVKTGQLPPMETTVAAILSRLMSLPPTELLTFFGRSDMLLRERIDSSGGDAIIPPGRTWLEMDMR